MADLKLDTAMIDQLARDLDAIRRDFEGADDFSDVVADATGHDELADKVRDFAHSWNDKRKQMVQSIGALHDQMNGIADAFEDTDAKLASALDDSGAA